MLDTLENLRAADPCAREIREVMCCVLGRMAELQDSGGCWHTVLNDPESYIETSIAAFIVSTGSRALLHSWISPEKFLPVVGKAMAFLLEHIRPDGVLEGVSYETFFSMRAEHYRRMPRGGVFPWVKVPCSMRFGHIIGYAELQGKVNGQDGYYALG